MVQGHPGPGWPSHHGEAFLDAVHRVRLEARDATTPPRVALVSGTAQSGVTTDNWAQAGEDDRLSYGSGWAVAVWLARQYRCAGEPSGAPQPAGSPREPHLCRARPIAIETS